jgi:hypothetical protein
VADETAGAADARIVEVDVPTVVAAVPIAEVVPVDRDSNAGPAAARDTTVVIRVAVPAPRVVRSSSRKC